MTRSMQHFGEDDEAASVLGEPGTPERKAKEGIASAIGGANRRLGMSGGGRAPSRRQVEDIAAHADMETALGGSAPSHWQHYRNATPEEDVHINRYFDEHGDENGNISEDEWASLKPKTPYQRFRESERAKGSESVFKADQPRPKRQPDPTRVAQQRARKFGSLARAAKGRRR